MIRTSFCCCALAGLALAAFGTPASAEDPAATKKMEEKLIERYPRHRLVKSCSGRFVGKDSNEVAVLRSKAKNEVVVVWLMEGRVQELNTIANPAPDFELQCMDAKEAQQRDHDLHTSEGITGSVKPPKGYGAVCFFTDNTTAQCWSLDPDSGRMVVVGGWET